MIRGVPLPSERVGLSAGIYVFTWRQLSIAAWILWCKVYEFPNPSDFSIPCNELEVGTVITTEFELLSPSDSSWMYLKAIALKQCQHCLVTMTTCHGKSCVEWGALLEEEMSCHPNSHFATVCLCAGALPGVFVNLHTDSTDYLFA